jgi:hypothetical protein
MRRLLELSWRLGFIVPKLDGELQNASERLLSDVLESLPKELFQFREPIPAAILSSCEEYLSSSTAVVDNVSRPAITSTSGELLLRQCG